jgi:hypothetical protein
VVDGEGVDGQEAGAGEEAGGGAHRCTRTAVGGRGGPGPARGARRSPRTISPAPSGGRIPKHTAPATSSDSSRLSLAQAHAGWRQGFVGWLLAGQPVGVDQRQHRSSIIRGHGAGGEPACHDRHLDRHVHAAHGRCSERTRTGGSPPLSPSRQATIARGPLLPSSHDRERDQAQGRRPLTALRSGSERTMSRTCLER